jgi:hypothetical protein
MSLRGKPGSQRSPMRDSSISESASLKTMNSRLYPLRCIGDRCKAPCLALFFGSR